MCEVAFGDVPSLKIGPHTPWYDEGPNTTRDRYTTAVPRNIAPPIITRESNLFHKNEKEYINPEIFMSPQIPEETYENTPGKLIASDDDDYIGPSCVAKQLTAKKAKSPHTYIQAPSLSKAISNSPKAQNIPSISIETDSKNENSNIQELLTPIPMDTAACDEDLAPSIPTPNRLTQEMRIRDISSSINRLEAYWQNRISGEQERARERIQALINQHVEERRTFEQKNGLTKLTKPPSNRLAAIASARNRARIFIPAPPPQPKQRATARKTKRVEEFPEAAFQALKDRQKEELLSLNEECTADVAAAREMGAKEVAARRAELEALLDEYRRCGGTAERVSALTRARVHAPAAPPGQPAFKRGPR